MTEAEEGGYATESELEQLHLDVDTADRIVNQLRMGLPPAGYVRQFTVGRQDELRTLEHDLATGMHGRAFLVRANYGGGKTHLLNLVRDLALLHGYAVALVEMSASQGVRGNRMDQVFAAVCRAVQLPGKPDKGLASLFRAYADTDVAQLDDEAQEERDELEDGRRWRQSELMSGPVYIALRAAVVSESDDVRDLAIGWLTNPNPDTVEKARLVDELDGLFVGDPRTRFQMYKQVQLRRDGQQPSWDALNDLDRVARLAGTRGLVLLFDEYEDVIHNLKNKLYEADALRNLFRFFGGDYLGGAYFAVTPDFVTKCSDQLLLKGVYDFPFRRFRELPYFELSGIEFDDFLKLSAQIITAHAQAFEWEPETQLDWSVMKDFLEESWQPHNPSRIRMACRALVELLDSELDRVG